MDLYFDGERKEQLLNAYKELLREHLALQHKYDMLETAYTELKDSCNHPKASADKQDQEAPQSGKGKAGRKPADAVWMEKFMRYRKLLGSGLKPKEIMAELKISPATYYRYQKILREGTLHEGQKEN